MPDFGADVFADPITPISRNEDQVHVELVEDITAGVPIFRQGHCGNVDRPAIVVNVKMLKDIMAGMGNGSPCLCCQQSTSEAPPMSGGLCERCNDGCCDNCGDDADDWS